LQVRQEPELLVRALLDRVLPVQELAHSDPGSVPPVPEAEDRPLARTRWVPESANQATKEMRASCVSFSLVERPRGFITDCSIIETTRVFLDALSFPRFMKSIPNPGFVAGFSSAKFGTCYRFLG
jgi:hypothetical protein